MSAVRNADFRVVAWQQLRPRMLAGKSRTQRLFPFDHPRIEYYYLARNGICALADAWGLAGQEVLVPAYCHGVEIEALQHSGAGLRFYPVREGMQVRAEDVIARVTSQTRAIYLIHYVGFPGPVRQLAEFCRKNKILLIEDCALALFSRLGDIPLGSWGDAGVFCLYKTLPLPNGGAVVINTPMPPCAKASRRPSLPSTVAYTAAAVFRHAHLNHRAGNGNSSGNASLVSGIRAKVKPVFEKIGLAKVGTSHFEPAHLGLGMSSICRRVIASLDCDAIVNRRRSNYQYLLSLLGNKARVVFPELPDGVCPLFFAIQTPHKQTVRERLLERGIESVNLWFFDAPGVLPGEFPEVDELRRTVLELPCHQDLDPETIEWMADEVSRLRAYL